MADSKEFEKLALPHADLLFRVAVSCCRDANKAEDLVQTTFLKGLRRFKTFRKGSNIKAWLLRILHNTWIDELRHRRVVGPTVPVEEDLLEEDQPAEAPWEGVDDLLRRFSDQHILDALKELPEEQKITLLLVDVADLSQEEVADITAVAVGTVKSRASRGRHSLKQKLQKHAEDLGFTGRR